MKNNIEEDIKIALDKFSDNRDIDSAMLIVEKFILGNYILLGGNRGNIVKDSLRYLLSDYKRILKEKETYKKQYFCLIDKIENKIDKFDYEFEKAKRKNYQERADYYWDLIRNFKKLLEKE